MIPRTLRPVLRAAAREYPVVTLTGPRQSGKTSLLRDTFPRHEYVSLEEPDQRSFALEDPRGFLDQFSGPAVLDEVQRAPELFSYIQGLVDRSPKAGRFILSGSQNFLLLGSVSQSLAGRSAILHLLPFSLAEIERRRALPLRSLGRSLPRASRRSSPPQLLSTLHRGFYPRIHDQELDPRRWYSGYYQTYVERDVRELANVGDLETFGRFVRLCAGRNGQLLNASALAADCGVTHSTARRWLSILEASFLVLLLRPHHRNFSKRLIKAPKLYFLDSGLLCYLLGIRSPEELRHHASRGAVFESFVVAELYKNYLHRGEEPGLHFWRDAAGHEVDLLLDDGRELAAVEIKSAQTVAGDFLANLRYFSSLAGEAANRQALVYGGDRSFRRSGVVVYRWFDL